jgi:menaquinone-dependent protoporphyrinogen IX oxidase
MTHILIVYSTTHGPTHPRAVVEFTDWRQVEAFAHTLADM